MEGKKTWTGLPGDWQKGALAAFEVEEQAIVLDWYNAGFTELSEAVQWYKSKIFNKSIEAIRWKKAGFTDPTDAHAWYNLNFPNPNKAFALYTEGFADKNAITLAKVWNAAEWFEFLEGKKEGDFKQCAKIIKLWSQHDTWKENPTAAKEWYLEKSINPEVASQWHKAFGGKLKLAEDWSEYFKTPSVAKNWYDVRFEIPEEAGYWYNAGFENPTVARQWHRAFRGNLKFARKWHNIKFPDPKLAKLWDDAGWFEPDKKRRPRLAYDAKNGGKSWGETILQWFSNGWKKVPNLAADWYDAGFKDPTVAKQWSQWFENPYNAGMWFSDGWEKNPEKAVKWSGFKNPDEARMWFKNTNWINFPEQAAHWSRWFENPDEAWTWFLDKNWEEEPYYAYSWHKAGKTPEDAEKIKKEYSEQGITNIHLDDEGEIVNERGHKVTLADRTGKGGKGNASKKAVIDVSAKKLDNFEVKALLEGNKATKSNS